MKLIAKMTVAAAFSVVAAGPVAAKSAGGDDICLHTFYIQSTHVVDAKTILFTMKDGTVYRNTLPVACGGLMWDGFTYNLHYEEICSSDRLPITILRTHQTCQLGGFTKLAPPSHT